MDKKIRYVRCAKCLKVLVELPDVPVYQCGGCGTLLQAKYYRASEYNSTSTLGSRENNRPNNLQGNELSDNRAALREQIDPSSDTESSLMAHVQDHSIVSTLSPSPSIVEHNVKLSVYESEPEQFDPSSNAESSEVAHVQDHSIVSTLSPSPSIVEPIVKSSVDESEPEQIDPSSNAKSSEVAHVQDHSIVLTLSPSPSLVEHNVNSSVDESEPEQIDPSSNAEYSEMAHVQDHSIVSTLSPPPSIGEHNIKLSVDESETEKNDPSLNAEYSEVAHVQDHSIVSTLTPSPSIIEHNVKSSVDESKPEKVDPSSNVESSEVAHLHDHSIVLTLIPSASIVEHNVKSSVDESETKEAVSDSAQLRTEDIKDENQPGKSIQIEVEKCSSREAESLTFSHRGSESSTLCPKLEETSNTDQSSFESNTEYSFKSEHEEYIQAEELIEESANPRNLGQPGSTTSAMSNKLEGSVESVNHATREDLLDREHGERHGEDLLSRTRSSQSYDGKRILNSVDTHPAPKLQYNQGKSIKDRHMHRIFSNKEASSSSRYHIPRQERGISPDSAHFYSVQDWLGSECPTRSVSRGTTFNGDSFNYEDGKTTAKSGNLAQDNSELLRKVNELKHQLSQLYDQREQQSRSHIRAPPRPPLFFNHGHGSSQPLNPNLVQHPIQKGYYRSRMIVPQNYQFSQNCSSCLHCDHHLQFQPNLCHSGPCGACAYNMCSRPPNAVNSHLQVGYSKTQMQDFELEKLVYKEKRQSSKRHCRPLSGGAPFVICDNCLELLQLPADFLISRRRIQKLQCGACSKVLSPSFQSRARKGQMPSMVFEMPSDIDSNLGGSRPGNFHEAGRISFSEEYGLSFSKNYSPEITLVRNDLASSSEERKVREMNSLALHRLMGYSTATEILYQPSDVDEGYESAQTMK